MISCQVLSELYKEACELELLAFKPGNVSVYSDGHGMCVQDFRLSASVSAESLCNPDYSLGEKIYYAVEATRQTVGCNTNLGILLLCAPLLQAVAQYNRRFSFRIALAKVLSNTTVQDAEWVFKAIELAAPGGIGKVQEHDVSSRPIVTLREAMQVSSHRDRIALQYITDFKDVFDFGVLRYNAGLGQWGKKDWSAVWVYTGLLSQYPDSHIERKYGNQYSELVASRMQILDLALADASEPDLLNTLFADVDREFKRKGINPGTSADLTVATILADLIVNCLNAAN